MPKDKSGERGGAAASKTADPRFSNFETDPRFRLPSRKKTKTTIDKRFSHRLKDDDFTSTAKVDRYGRKLKDESRKKALQSLYQEEDEDDEEGKKGEEAIVDDDEVIQRELRSVNVKYDPARGGGFSDSESESELDEDEDEEGGAELEAGPSLDKFREEQAGVETGEVTNRIAIVNLDWDHIKSVDLMALFSSFAPTGGRIEKLSIYPSEFGRGRMQREELEGPPKEIFKKNKAGNEDLEEALEDSEDEGDDADEDEDEELDSDEEVKDLIKEGDDKDFDSDALRSYQMDRLRYYYAVMICSNAPTAQKIYEATDGSEYMSSSNFLDLRFVPDDVTFDDEPRDECDSVPAGYKPIEFVTDALQHSKVKLTWDMHPEELSRKETIKKAFSGSRADIADNDLRAYLASDSEGEDDEEGDEEPADVPAAEDGPQLTKKELARRKMRAALGLGDEPAPRASKTGPVGDMQITFSAALTELGSNEDGPNAEETTIEKYKRKEKERKAKRKEKAVAKREGIEEEEAGEAGDVGADGQGEDLGFDDPFFTTEEPAQATKSAMRKEERRQKREAKEAEEAANAAEKAQLELLMAENTNDQAVHLDHFDMNEIVREEKRKGKKQKKKGKSGKEERGGLQEDFDLDVADPRFKAVFESHEFAIDPSNPKFKATSGMKKLLEEGRKRKAGASGLEEEQDRREKKKSKDRHGDLGRLVDVVKKKSSKR